MSRAARNMWVTDHRRLDRPVLITGSADGLGRAAARALLEQGHETSARGALYLGSGMHRGGRATLRGVDWSGPGSCSDSKLFVPALAMAVARSWPDVRSNVVDPGWGRRGWAARARPTICGSGT